MPLHPRRCSALYSFSCLLDAIDGMLARRYNQSTRFGAVLDMVTDRCTTTCLLVFLSTAKPAYSIVFQCLISLDLASHYVHMYATLATGGAKQSHKDMSTNRNRLMTLYYTNTVRYRGMSSSAGTGGTANVRAGSPFHLLRIQRVIFHRSVFAVLLWQGDRTSTIRPQRQRCSNNVSRSNITIFVSILSCWYGTGSC